MKKPQRTPEQTARVHERLREADREASFLFAWQIACDLQRNADEEEKHKTDDKDPAV